MFCQKCGKENSNDAAFCNSCGADLRRAPIPPADPLLTGSCQSCGMPIKPGEKLCSKCLSIKLEDMKVDAFTPKTQRIDSLKSKITDMLFVGNPSDSFHLKPNVMSARQQR